MLELELFFDPEDYTGELKEYLDECNGCVELQVEYSVWKGSAYDPTNPSDLDIKKIVPVCDEKFKDILTKLAQVRLDEIEQKIWQYEIDLAEDKGYRG